MCKPQAGSGKGRTRIPTALLTAFLTAFLKV
jgi:hypothetical protein